MKPAAQSSTYDTAVASLANDNDMFSSSCTFYWEQEPWWTVDLGTPMNVGRVCVTNDKNLNSG